MSVARPGHRVASRGTGVTGADTSGTCGSVLASRAMSTIVTTWLGIAFLALAVAGVLLQAWLWGPKFWNAELEKTEAPRFWLRVHALCGYTYGLIYLVMMWHMLPRLWEYQYELPARTVFHAVLAITIGVLLVCKIAILLFFRHFEEAMPYYGFGLLLSTVILIVLSVPYALRAHDLLGDATSAENIERVDALLADIDFGEDVDRAVLTTEDGLRRGKHVLVSKCVVCHDMRTILVKPRTAAAWYDVNTRMLEKPSIFRQQLEPEEIPYVTAYLVAITPSIQRSVKQKREVESAEKARKDATADAMHQGDARAVPTVDAKEGEALLQNDCTQCHGLEDVDAHGPDDLAGWRSVVAAMIEEGAELDEADGERIAAYLAQKYPAKTEVVSAKAETGEEKAEVDGDARAEAAAKADGTVGEQAEAKAESAVEAQADGDAKAEKPAPRPKRRKPKAKPIATEAGDQAGAAAAPPEPDAEPKAPPKPKASGSAAAGKPIFLAKCKGCHGADGKGDTAYGQKIGVRSLAGTSLSRAKVRSIVENGVAGTKMKGYDDKLPPQEIDDVSAFVKSLR